MFFAKKQSHFLSKMLFILSYGFLLSFFVMTFGEKLGFFEEGVSLNSVGFSFIVGMIVGYFLEKKWSQMSGIHRELISSLVLFLSSSFWAMVFLAFGADLGGNGILTMDWAGLGGYESVGLVFGCFGGFIGTWLGIRALMPSKKTAALLAINGAALLIFLFAGDALQNPNLSSLSVFALPTLSIVLHYGFKF